LAINARLEVNVMSIDSLTNAAVAAGYAMAACEELLGEQRLDELPESPVLPEAEDLRRELPRLGSRLIVTPKVQPAMFDWLAFWRVPA
jgi:hypothetical protein